MKAMQLMIKLHKIKNRGCLFSMSLFVLLIMQGNMKLYCRQLPLPVLIQDTGGIPYHPLVYHLDLSILAYQIYSQTLAWPFDSYYEKADLDNGFRKLFMSKVYSWAKTKGDEQLIKNNGCKGYHGPGILNGFETNNSHDPIIYRYNHIYPWSSTITNADGKWTEYLTPKEITRSIRTVYVSYRKTGQPVNDVALDSVSSKIIEPGYEARDILLAFEGGTGDKGEAGQPASQSLMGFVLLRFWPGSDNYDIHISFRGSRSGSANRAIKQAISTQNANGNADWITDLGYRLIGPDNGGGHISTTGNVHRGMAKSLESIYPQLFRCLREVVKLASNKVPSRIYVTGHSLGGALAQHFISAVLQGDIYGPGGKGLSMPYELQNWPWENIKLVSFGAPRVGDDEWAKKLTIDGLKAGYYSSMNSPYDENALKTTDPEILTRLLDIGQPAGYRVLISTDPITLGKIISGMHVGKTIYVNKPSASDIMKLMNFESHEPLNIRNYMLASLNDSRIPAFAWRYHKMEYLNPDENIAGRGTAPEYKKLAAAIDKYYYDNKIWFDHLEFNADLNLFLSILPDK